MDSAAAADLALEVLTSSTYPSWINMLSQGATCTMEAWRAADKSNLDFAHPWCASPSFTIPGAILGASPLLPGWSRWRLAPQPSSLTSMDARVPTPAGMLTISFTSAHYDGGSNASVLLVVLPQQACQVCLAVSGTFTELQQRHAVPASSDKLYVNTLFVSSVSGSVPS